MNVETSSDDVIDQNQVPTDDVIDQQQPDDTGAVQPEQSTTETSQTPQESQPVEVNERPQINREAEWHRKYENLVEQMPNMIEEAVQKSNKPQEQEYSISQLEAFAIQNPEQRPWVEEKKAELIQKRIQKTTEERLAKEREQLTAQQTKQQAEAAVVNDPKFAEAFVTLPNGQKDWNHNSELAQRIASYMNEPRLKGQPDAVLVAAKLARADMLDTQVPQKQQQLTALQRQNAKLKNQTMVEGGGVQHQEVPTDEYAAAKEQAARTGRMADVQKAVQGYLKKIGKIK
jgi:hypothetical protein